MISGRMLRDAFISAANNIAVQRQTVDALNVFPVPDGDTGTNMSMTIGSAVRELKKLPDTVAVGHVADIAASALLRGARGNSGVILSLLFRGFSKGLHDKEAAGAADFALALKQGVSAAYKAVMKPTEGTILTVARLAAEHAQELAAAGVSIRDFWNGVLDAGRAALEKTPELLPVLKKAGVVDAGGMGFIVILEGMNSVFQSGEIMEPEPASAVPARAEPVLTEFDTTGGFDGQINFTYCTEFIVNKNSAKDPLPLRAYLESIGDCVVVVDDDDIIKVHVHTEEPGKALQEGLAFGPLTNMKIENMREQFEHRRAAQAEQSAAAQEPKEEFPYMPVDPERRIGFVAVAAGDGIRSLFTDLGADRVVSGGQTMNPSTDDILNAVQSTPAKTVFVLPNNKNIILAAEQAARLADREVRVLQTLTIPQGMAAMLAFEPDQSVSENAASMTGALERVQTGMVTFAARDSDIEGFHIKEGELLALQNGKVVFADSSMEKTLLKLTRSLIDKETGFVTVLYGQDITEDQAAALEELLLEKLSDDLEITFIRGGQPVYYFIISAE